MIDTLPHQPVPPPGLEPVQSHRVTWSVLGGHAQLEIPRARSVRHEVISPVHEYRFHFTETRLGRVRTWSERWRAIGALHGLSRLLEIVRLVEHDNFEQAREFALSLPAHYRPLRKIMTRGLS